MDEDAIWILERAGLLYFKQGDIMTMQIGQVRISGHDLRASLMGCECEQTDCCNAAWHARQRGRQRATGGWTTDMSPGPESGRQDGVERGVEQGAWVDRGEDPEGEGE